MNVLTKYFPQFHLLDATVVNVVGSPTATVNHLLSMWTNDGSLNDCLFQYCVSVLETVNTMV